MAPTHTAKPRKPYHHGDLREMLLQSGEAVLVNMGIGAMTLREIARRAGVSHAAPKHHFASLGELLGEIAARGFERFVAELQSAADHASRQQADERLIAMGIAYISFARANAAVYGLMFGKNGHCEFTPHLRMASGAAWHQLETAATAVVGVERALAAAVQVWSTVHGFAMLQNEHRLPSLQMTPMDQAMMMRRLLAGLKAKDI